MLGIDGKIKCVEEEVRKIEKKRKKKGRKKKKGKISWSMGGKKKELGKGEECNKIVRKDWIDWKKRMMMLRRKELGLRRSWDENNEEKGEI